LKKKKDMEVDNWSQRSRKETINKDWYKKLQLDEKRYYQLRFPDKGVFMQTDSIEGIAPQDTFYRDIAQFAPHLVKDGKEQPIYLIYCNQNLVYYYEANPQSPYSFVGLEGYNQITIRGRDFSYTMDSVLLKKGHKLTFSIDENHYSLAKNSINIHRIAVENQFSKTELRLLKQRIFQLRTEVTGINYVFQDKYSIHPLQTGNNYNGKTWKFGPFSSKRDLTLIRQDAFENTFLFESGFKYEIAENRERLYKSKYFDEAFPLPKKLADKALGESIFHPHHIIARSPDVLPTIQYDSQNHSTQAENGWYYFEYRTPKNNENELMAVVLMANDTTRYIYGKYTRSLQNLPPNDYQLLLIKQNGGYLQKDFTIEANTLTFQRIDSTAIFLADSSLQMFKKVLQQRFKKDVPMVVPKSNGENLSIGGNGISGIRGYVTDKETLETLPFVNVAVNVGGHLVGTTTDFDGYYELHLRAGRYSLTYSYVGYQTKKIEGIAVSGYNYTNMNVELNTSSEVLAIVQVVSYSVPLLEQKIRAISSLDGILTGSASGVSKTIISAGERPEDSYELPDYMDGNDLLQNREESTEYFIDGIKVTGLNQLQFEENRQQLRSNFSDYAYWQPNLLTDQNGEAYFTATFPDNTTEWKTFVLGMNAKEQGGFVSTTTNAYKEIMAELSVPRFLIEGDETNVLGKSLNYTGDSIRVQTQFKMEEDVLQSNTENIKEVLVEKAKITAPPAAKQDSVNLTYLLEMEDGYGDGEKRQIPILKKGIEETVGDFYALKKDTSIQLSFNENLGEVHLYAENSVLDLLQKDLDYLQNYPYGCNEQNASRLMALLMDKEIKQQLGEVFGKEKALRTTLKKIEKARNGDGSWGWWKGNSFNLWMTLYISKALKKAELAGHNVEPDEWTLRLLVNRLPQLEGRNLLMVLSYFAEIGLNTDFEKHLQKVDSTMVKPQLNDQLQILKIRQLWKLPHDLQLLDSLRQSTTFGNYYWGKKGHGWHDNAIQNTLLAFDIYQRANRTEDCQKIIAYFLERRGRNSWRNTFETAQILQAILPTLLKESGVELEENKLVL
ncbi:MAG: carboxypeptidase-like regulatory domain-containing protein, partial [Chitinophagales bacterium]